MRTRRFIAIGFDILQHSDSICMLSTDRMEEMELLLEERKLDADVDLAGALDHYLTQACQ